MRRALIVGFALALNLAAARLAAAPPLDYQDPPPDPPGQAKLAPVGPGSLQAMPAPRLDGVGPFQRLPQQDESPPVVVAVRKVPWWQAGTLDPVLTNACKLGYFVSVPLNRMVVQFTDPKGPAALNIIPPDRRHLLVDLRHLAQPGETYYFKDSTFPTCQVWVDPPRKPRTLNAGGTSLPPVDPKALKNREAEIAAWPKKDAGAGPSQ